MTLRRYKLRESEEVRVTPYAYLHSRETPEGDDYWTKSGDRGGVQVYDRETLDAAVAEERERLLSMQASGLAALIRAQERERCAKLCVTQAAEADGSIDYRDACHDCAAAIRGEAQ